MFVKNSGRAKTVKIDGINRLIAPGTNMMEDSKTIRMVVSKCSDLDIVDEMDNISPIQKKEEPVKVAQKDEPEVEKPAQKRKYRKRRKKNVEPESEIVEDNSDIETQSGQIPEPEPEIEPDITSEPEGE